MKTRMLTVCAAAALLFAAGLTAAQAPAGAPAAPPAGAPGGRAGGPPSLDFFKTDDPRSNPFTRAQIEGWKTQIPSGSGPYGAVRGEPDTLPTNTIFYPKDLAKVKGKMPILSFANGACSGQPLELTEVYTELASQGFFVATIGRIGGTVNGGDLSLQIKFIDWAIAENGRKDSPFYNKLDTTKIGLSGQSCGGVMAIRNAGDPRVSTVLILNSGIFIAGAPGAPRGGAPAVEAAALRQRAHRARWTRRPRAQPDGRREGGAQGLSHPGRLSPRRTERHRLCQRRGRCRKDRGRAGLHGQHQCRPPRHVRDSVGRRIRQDRRRLVQIPAEGRQDRGQTFVGPDCKLCTNPLWEVKRKNM